MKRAISRPSVFGLSLFALLLALGAAHADPQASEPRSVPAFHAVELAGTMEVDVTVGKGQSVQVSGEADLLGKVTTVVKDGVLVVDTPRDLRRRHHLKVTVTVPELSAVSLSGTGEMKIGGVELSEMLRAEECAAATSDFRDEHCGLDIELRMSCEGDLAKLIQARAQRGHFALYRSAQLPSGSLRLPAFRTCRNDAHAMRWLRSADRAPRTAAASSG